MYMTMAVIHEFFVLEVILRLSQTSLDNISDDRIESGRIVCIDVSSGSSDNLYVDIRVFSRRLDVYRWSGIHPALATVDKCGADVFSNAVEPFDHGSLGPSDGQRHVHECSFAGWIREI